MRLLFLVTFLFLGRTGLERVSEWEIITSIHETYSSGLQSGTQRKSAPLSSLNDITEKNEINENIKTSEQGLRFENRFEDALTRRRPRRRHCRRARTTRRRRFSFVR